MRRGAFTRTLISGFILASSSIAQSAIDDFSNKIITIKPFVEVSTYSFDIKAPATGARLIWKPSERAATGIDIYTHKRFGFSLGLGFSGKGGLTAEDQVKKGNTKFEDWRFSLAYENAYLNANYQRYTGFYLENSDAADNTWNSSKPYRQESACRSGLFSS